MLNYPKSGVLFERASTGGTFKQNNGVKRGGYIKLKQNSCLLIIGGPDDIVNNLEQPRLREITYLIGRIKITGIIS
jgi:hypothetical protein